MTLEQIIISLLASALSMISFLVIYIWNSTLKGNKEGLEEVKQGLNAIKGEHVQINLKLAVLSSEMQVVHKDNSRLEAMLDKQTAVVTVLDKRLIKMEEWKLFADKLG